MTPELQPVPVFVTEEEIPDTFGPFQKEVLWALSTATVQNPIAVIDLADMLCDDRNIHAVVNQVNSILCNPRFQIKLEMYLGCQIASREVEVKGMGRRRAYYLELMETGSSGRSVMDGLDEFTESRQVEIISEPVNLDGAIFLPGRPGEDVLAAFTPSHQRVIEVLVRSTSEKPAILINGLPIFRGLNSQHIRKRLKLYDTNLVSVRLKGIHGAKGYYLEPINTGTSEEFS